MSQEKTERLESVGKAIHDLRIHQHGKEADPVTHQQYGFIKFDESPFDGDERLAQFIRLSLETTSEIVVQFMRTGWGLPAPDLIISVTGGAKNFEMSARLRKIFQRGLVSAAITTNAWLITAGTNAGVVKEVGEAFSNYRYKNRKQDFDIPCIGIGSWGYTSHNELLEKSATQAKLKLDTSEGEARSSSVFFHSKSRGTVHASSTAIPMGSELRDHVRNYVVDQRKDKRCDLEPNHTHFLLFDDGNVTADSVLSLRSEIEKKSQIVPRVVDVSGSLNTMIPIVMVLVEGGPSSCRTICQGLESNTPIVVVKDSGRLADLVADLHGIYTETESSSTSAHASRSQTAGHTRTTGNREEQINTIFAKAKADNSWVDEIKDELRRTIEAKKQLVTVFKFDSKRHHGNLEDAILESLINAANFVGANNDDSRRTTELRLAMAWNKIQYARKNILTDTNIKKWPKKDLQDALFEGLRRGRLDFVELLIEFGASFTEITLGDLNNLYESSDKNHLLPTKIGRKVPKKTKELYYEDYFRSFRHYSEIQGKLPDGDLKSPLGQQAPRHLLYWAIFSDRYELAMYLCSKNWNSTIAAIFASHMYRRAARHTSDSDLKKRYEDNASKFDFHAMTIIDKCFDNDENFAVELVKRPVASFDNIRPLVLAYKANCRPFLASKCVQRVLDNAWFGNINYKRQYIQFWIFLCTLFLPLIPVFCFTLPYVKKSRTVSLNIIEGPNTDDATVTRESKQSYASEKTVNISLLERIKYFYRAPIVRFYYYTIFFVAFLGLFSFVMLVDYFPPNNNDGRRSGVLGLYIPITEIILHICIWSLIVEEIRQLCNTRWKRDYITDIWNVIDLIAAVLYIIGFITRFFYTEGCFTASKIFMCLDLIVWFVRTLHLFAAYEKLGPKLTMIFDTMKDLLFFVCFIIIFLMAFSIASWSLLTTNDQVIWNYNGDGSVSNVTITGGGSGLWTWSLLRTVTNYGIWKIFGQVDEIGNYNAYGSVAFVLAILFLAVANVLLLNLLVALFNLTIQNVQSQSHRIWRYQRFLLVVEYNAKPPIPPPFNNFYYIFAITRYLFTKCAAYRKADEDILDMSAVTINQMATHHKKFIITDAMQRESAIADDYWHTALQEAKRDPVEIKLHHMEETLHSINDHIRKQNTNDQQGMLFES